MPELQHQGSSNTLMTTVVAGSSASASSGADIDLSEVRDQLELGGSLEGIEVYMAILYGRDGGLFEYLENPVLFCDDETEIAGALESAMLPSYKEYERHADRKTHLPPDRMIRLGSQRRHPAPKRT